MTEFHDCGIACDCPPRGWKGAPFVEEDGKHWPLSFAADLLEIPEQDLRDLIRIVNNISDDAITPTGVIRMSSFRRQGRQPRAYPGDKLSILVNGVTDLAHKLSISPDSA